MAVGGQGCEQNWPEDGRGGGPVAPMMGVCWWWGSPSVWQLKLKNPPLSLGEIDFDPFLSGEQTLLRVLAAALGSAAAVQWEKPALQTLGAGGPCRPALF